jgi:hypothetical protein
LSEPSLGDVSLSAEDRPPSGSTLPARNPDPASMVEERVVDVEHEDDEHSWLVGHTARYLLAGGIAGAGAPYFYSLVSSSMLRTAYNIISV